MALWIWRSVFLSCCLNTLTLASPVVDQAAVAQITPSPVQDHPTRTWKHRRDIISDLKGDVNSILSGLGSDIPSYVASGIPNFFQDFPTGDSVASSLSLDKSQIAALPTQVLNIVRPPALSLGLH